MRMPGISSAVGGGIEAEDAEEGGGGADGGEGAFEGGDGVGHDVEVELVFEGTAVDGAAFDLIHIDIVAGKGFEGGEERARLVREAEGDGHFVGARRSELRGLRGRNEQNKARKIFGIVVNVFGENDAAVD